MRQTRLTAVTATLLAGLSAAAQPLNPIRWAFVDAPPRKTLKPGVVFKVRVKADIDPGWHLYSLTPLEGGPIPTRIWLPEGQPFEPASAPQAPRPLIQQDSNFGMEVGYYEGSPVFTLPIKAASGAPAGKQTLIVNARFQSCNDRLCLPPKRVELRMAVEVAGKP